MYMPHIKFQDSSISGSRVSQLPSITDRQTDRQTDGQTDRQTDGQAQTNMPLNFFEVGGIKIGNSEKKFWVAAILAGRSEHSKLTKF